MRLIPVRRASRLVALTLSLFGTPFVGGQLAAQAPSRIVGRVVDSKTGTALAGVGVQVVGTTTGTTSGVDGRFVLGRVTAGTVTLHLRRIGYQPKTVTGLLVS